VQNNLSLKQKYLIFNKNKMTKLYVIKGWSEITTKGPESNLVFNEDKALINAEWVDMKRSEFIKYCRENGFTININ